MSKMSRRKQSKPQHISNGSDDETPPADGTAATTASLGDVSTEINTEASDPKPDEPTKFVRFTRKQAQLLRATEEKDHLNGPCDNKVKIAKETNNNDKVVSDTEVESEQEEASTDNLELDSSDVAPKTAENQPMTTNHPRLRDRTCEYCGAVKPTPAALARHLRKHTGERPFVCQGCNKAYKAKRSLQLHQLTYHPELVNKTPPHQASGVSLCTSSLLREALETRIKQDLSNYSGPHLDETTGEFVEDGSCEHPDLNSNPQSEEKGEQEAPSMIGALLSKTVNMPTIQTPGYPGDTSKSGEEEESGEKLNNRTCYICGKVCSKPCDLKRHILMHTGERPFRCEVCGKCFKAKASMLYHQRAAHNMAVELSQGLEERYLRLKNRSLMKSLHVQDQLKEYEQPVVAPGSSSHTPDDLEDLCEGDGDFSDKNNLFNSDNCSVHYSEGGISRQVSHTSDGSGLDNDSAFNESLENGNETLVIDDGEFTCNKLRIRNETVIVTRLDGINSSTGKEVSMFKCYMCGRMFSSLNRIQCHLSMHFELEITTYQCKYCDAAFKQKSQMVQHVLKHKIKAEQEEGFDNISEDDVRLMKDEQLDSGNDLSGISPSSESDNTKAKSDGSETSPDVNSIKQIRFNGNHECKYCRKTFSRQFLLQRHERIHTGQKAFYCKECGKGFSESVNLTQHLSLFHSDSPQVRQAARLYNKARHRSLHRVNYWDKYTKQSPNQLQRAIASLDKSSSKSIPDLEKHEDFEKAKELLEKDGIKEEVTVVMPSAPPSSQSETVVSAPSPDPVLPESVPSEGMGDQEDSSNSEIMTAPKRSLISFCKEGPQVKSRRKASLPTKFDNGSPESGAHEEDIGFKDDAIRVKNEESDEAESPGPGIPGNSEESAAYSTAKMVASINPLLLANNTSSTLGPSLLGSGPGLLPCISTPTSSSMGSLMNLPISVQCSSGDPSAARCPSPTQSNSSTSQASPADPEALVGCPRVQWNTPPTEDPSPPLSYGRESERKPLPDWHPLSKVALNQIVTHDGRKVTSLSRTHSRLHVVNQPVDRDQVCKPTVLADGRAVYRCFFCAKDFLSFSDINRHMDFHEDIRPYKCQFCDYYARTNSQLKVHMMRHQGIREFCCKLCNYKGVTQSDLNRHMKSQIHMLKARNECKRCGEGFVTPKNLEKHLEGNCKRLVKKENLDQSDYDS